MGNLFKFETEQEECQCSTCELIERYYKYFLDADNKDELHYLISELVDEAQQLGVRDYLLNEINMKIDTLNNIAGYCECEDDDCCDVCCGCKDGECELN